MTKLWQSVCADVNQSLCENTWYGSGYDDLDRSDSNNCNASVCVFNRQAITGIAAL